MPTAGPVESEDGMEEQDEKPEPTNLAEMTYRVCGEKYDTPHKETCVQRRNPPTPSGKLRVLVKMEDV